MPAPPAPRNAPAPPVAGNSPAPPAGSSPIPQEEPEQPKDATEQPSGWDGEKEEVPSKGQAAGAAASGWDSDEEKQTKEKPTQQSAPEVPSSGQLADAGASGWDSDPEEGSKAKKQASVPVCGQAADATASGWDDEKEEDAPPKKSTGSPAKDLSVQLAALVTCADCGRKFNGESLEKHKRVCKKVFQSKREKFNSAANRLGEFVNTGELVSTDDTVQKVPEKVPEGPVEAKGGAEASGFDSDDGEAGKAQKPAAAAAPKGGMALEFDMGDGPRKAMPKALAARLSKKPSKKSKRFTCQDRASTKDELKADPAASGWDSDGEKKKKAGPAVDVCGAPVRDVEAFVAAKPCSAAPAPEPAKPTTELGNLLNDVLADQNAANAPFRGSGSHAFVPNFQCLACDHQVLKVEKHVWSSDVSNMFLRNNYPNVMKLRAQLKPQEGTCAYCCQCSSRSADAAAALEDVAEGLRWRIIQA